MQNELQSTASDPRDNSDRTDLLIADGADPGDSMPADQLVAAVADGGQAVAEAALPPLDYSVFGHWPFADMSSNVVLILGLTAFAVASVWSWGLAVKLSSRLFAGRLITVRQGITASWVAMITFLLVFPAQRLFLPSVPTVLTGLVGLLLAVLMFAAVLREHPRQIVATAFGSLVLGGIFSGGLMYLALFFVTSQVPQERIERLADHTRPFTESVIEHYGPDDEQQRDQLRQSWTLDAISQRQEAIAAEASQPIVIRDPKLRDNPFASPTSGTASTPPLAGDSQTGVESTE